MPGRSAYTMKEQRDIVAYLVEHGAYGEVRARNMWQEYELSQRTTRTWQSLKETFLKRILPDIHNPYYNLTPDQIASFRSGKNITKMNINKLLLAEGKQSSKVLDAEINVSEPDNHKKDNSVTGTGELPEAMEEGRRSERSSVDTVVLDTADKFADAEDIIHSLEAKEGSSSSRRLKDLIVYTEPLTPMMQQIEVDWETDSSNGQSNGELRKKKNGDEVVSTADTYLPNNQEAIKATDSQLSAISNTQASGPSKTRSQSNTQSSSGTKTRSQVNDSVLKGVLNKMLKNEIIAHRPTEKKARLNDEAKTVTSNPSQIITIEESGNNQQFHDENVPRTRSKKNIVKEKVGEFYTTEDLLSVLTDTILPNNQEGMRATRTFLDTQPSDKGSIPDTQNTEISQKTKTGNAASKIKSLKNKTSSGLQDADDKNESQVSDGYRTKRSTRNLNADLLSVLTNTILPNNQEGMRAIRKFLDPQQSDERTTSDTQQTDNSQKTKTKNADSKSRSTKNETSSDSQQDADVKSDSQVSDTNRKRSARTANEKITDLTESQSQRDNPDQKKASQTARKGNIPTETVANKAAKLMVSDDRNKNLKPSRTPSPILGLKEKDDAPPVPKISATGTELKATHKVIKKKRVASPKPSSPEELRSSADFQSHSPVLNAESEVNTRNATAGSPVNSQTGTEMDTIELFASDGDKETENNNELHGSNPCLQSVSLYKETEEIEAERASQVELEAEKDIQKADEPKESNQVTITELDHAAVLEVTDHDDVASETERAIGLSRKPVKAVKNSGVVMLPSHSSESDDSFPVPTARRGKPARGSLHKLFGFADGHSRSRRSRKRVHEHIESVSSSESDWSEGSLEDVIPVPRPGRHHLHHMRRPAVGRVRTLADGSLVALCGGRVYSLVTQRGSRMYGHRYAPPRGSAKETTDDEPLTRPKKPRAAPPTVVIESDPESRSSKETRVPEVGAAGAGPGPGAAEGGGVPRNQACVELTKDKITISGDVERILSVLPRFQQVMRALAPAGAEPAADAGAAPGAAERGARQSSNASVDDNEVRERVAAIEGEIFKRIAEQDAALAAAEAEREGAPPEPAPVRTEAPAADPTPREEVAKRRRERKVPGRPPVRRSIRSPRVSEAEAPGAGAGADPGPGAEPRAGAERERRGASDSEHEIIIQEEKPRRRAVPPRDTKSVYARGTDSGSEREVRYALPGTLSPPETEPAGRTTGKRRRLDKKNKITPQEISCESTQGYQDSDASPDNLNLNRRRRFSHQLELNRRRCNSLQRYHTRRSYEPRRRSSVITLKNLMRQSSDSESPTYSKRPQEKETQTSPDKIIVGVGTDSEDLLRLTPQPDYIGSRDSSLPGLDEDLPRCNAKDVANSSNVTLPPSPEISIVEQISVRARSLSRYNTINDQMEMNSTCNPRRVSIVLDQLDFTCPLMEQEFTVASVETQRNTNDNPSTAEGMEICATIVEDMVVSGNSTEVVNLKQKHQDTVTDSLISRVTEVNINDTPTLESIEIGLSAVGASTGALADVVNVKQTLRTGKSSMKRCSTPNKRKKVRKSQPPAVPSVAEEELIQHTEYCTQKRRKSCPALFHLERTQPTESDLFKLPAQTKKYSPMKIPQVVITPARPIDTVTQRRPRKPKSKVIKVKILRPKKSAGSPDEKTRKKKRSSIGVTERNKPGDFHVKAKTLAASVGSLEASNSDVPSDKDELVHNHSDSCIAGQLCTADAFTQSSRSEGSDRHELTPSPDCFSSEARDATRFSESSSPGTAVLRLSELGSLLTEDASVSSGEPDKGGWGEESWAARSDAEEEAELRARYGAHISSLYPLVSAVPHLSTITEASCDTRSRGALSRDVLSCDALTRDALSRDAPTFGQKTRDAMPTDIPSRVEPSRDVQSAYRRDPPRSRRVCPDLQPTSRRVSSDDEFVTCSSTTPYSPGMA